MSAVRCEKNPIIKPQDVKPTNSDFEVIGAFNAGVTRLNEEVILLVRVAERPVSAHPETALSAVWDWKTAKVVTESFDRNDENIDFIDPRMIIAPWGKFLTSLSHLRVARSRNGVDFTISDKPAIFPANRYESFGVEDPRITKIDDTYYIDYVGVSPEGVTTCLASTKDFETFQRHGVIFCPDNKDVILFPEKIAGRYWAIHRPVTPLFEKYQMWIAESPDLRSWGDHRFLMGVSENKWDNCRIGGSAVPFLIDDGWLEVYHGVDENNRYCLGAVLLDREEPWKILARTSEPILEPETVYEKEGFFGNVVFSCGLLFEDDKLKVYYGVSDTSIAYAQIELEDVLSKLMVV